MPSLLPIYATGRAAATKPERDVNADLQREAALADGAGPGVAARGKERTGEREGGAGAGAGRAPDRSLKPDAEPFSPPTPRSELPGPSAGAPRPAQAPTDRPALSL